MARGPKEEHPKAQPPQEEDPTHPHAATHAHARSGGSSYVVTFPGQPPCTVEAGSPEEAVEKAAKELGVVSSERPPDVVKVEG